MSAITDPLKDLANQIFWEARLARFQLAMKAGFNENQLRDDHGKWTGGDVSAESAKYRVVEGRYGEESDATRARFAKETMTRELTRDESDAVKSYQAESRLTNQTLRESDGKTGGIPALDSAIDAGRLTEKVTLFRGIDPSSATRVIRGLNPGDAFVDYGYVSTSISSRISDLADVTVVMKILAPKDSNGLITGHGLDSDEVILPRGSRFEFLGRDSADSTYVFRGGVLSAGGKAKSRRPLIGARKSEGETHSRFVENGEGLIIERTDGTRWRVGPDGELSKA